MAHNDADMHGDVHSSLMKKREDEAIEELARKYATDNRVLYSEALRAVRAEWNREKLRMKIDQVFNAKIG